MCSNICYRSAYILTNLHKHSIGRSNQFTIASSIVSYPIKYIYRKKGLPVKLVKEYDNWYQVQDLEDDLGWVAKSYVNLNFKTVIATRDDVIYNRANPKSKPIFRVEKNVVMSNLGCREDFCRISVSNKKGWINKKSIWGTW